MFLLSGAGMPRGSRLIPVRCRGGPAKQRRGVQDRVGVESGEQKSELAGGKEKF